MNLRNALELSWRKALIDAGENLGTRMAALWNARLPAKPDKKFTSMLLIELAKVDPKGLTSYFEWLGEFHPHIYAALLARVLPNIIKDESNPTRGPMVVYSSAEEIEKVFREHNLPPLQKVFQLPQRIDLNDPTTIEAEVIEEESPKRK